MFLFLYSTELNKKSKNNLAKTHKEPSFSVIIKVICIKIINVKSTVYFDGSLWEHVKVFLVF